MRSVARILVIRGGAIGDFVLTLPVLTSLHHHFPSAQIEMLANSQVTPLAVESGLADAARELDARAWVPAFVPDGELSSDHSQWLAGFDLVISYLHDPKGIFRANLCRCTDAFFIQGKPRPTETNDQHATEFFLQPLAEMGIKQVPGFSPLPMKGVGLEGNWLALHPGSGSVTKNWPEKNWLELLDRLAGETDWKLLLIGGEAEADRLPRLSQRLPSNRCHVLQNKPLLEVARTLRDSHGFLGHDSGITHLAAALGVQGMALWGPSNPFIWRPMGKSIHVLHPSGGLKALSASAVFTSLNKHLPKLA